MSPGYNTGVLVGYKWLVSPWVLGVEGDIDSNSLTQRFSGPSGALGTQVDSIYAVHVRGLVGYRMGDFEPFVAGGLASDYQVQSRQTPNEYIGASSLRAGWTLGAGVDFNVEFAHSGRLHPAGRISLRGPLERKLRSRRRPLSNRRGRAICQGRADFDDRRREAYARADGRAGLVGQFLRRRGWLCRFVVVDERPRRVEFLLRQGSAIRHLFRPQLDVRQRDARHRRLDGLRFRARIRVATGRRDDSIQRIFRRRRRGRAPATRWGVSCPMRQSVSGWATASRRMRSMEIRAAICFTRHGPWERASNIC